MSGQPPDQPSSGALAEAGKGCLLFVVAYAGAAYGLYLWSATQTSPHFALVSSLVAALFLALAALSLWDLLKRVLSGEDPRVEMLVRLQSGEMPAADGPVFAVGKVRATSGLLKAPLSGLDCVAYFYRMGDVIEYDDQDRGPGIRPVYWGMASRPFTLDTKQRALRVVGVPWLDRANVRLATPEHVARARDYIAASVFEEKSGLPGAMSSAFSMVQAHISDEDGDYRKDWKLANTVRDPGSLQLNEVAIAEGDEISLSGMWSVERAAVVSSAGAPLKLSKDLSKSGRNGAMPMGNLGVLIWFLATAALGASIMWFGIALPTLIKKHGWNIEVTERARPAVSTSQALIEHVARQQIQQACEYTA